MIKQREANSWKSVSYAKSITGTQTYTKFPIVLRTTEQSIPTWSVKGNMVQNGTPTPTSPITPSECGTATLNVMPSASQQSIENNGITITCDGKGSYHVFGTSTNAVSIEFDIPTFTIPTCVNSGGLGTMSLFNGQIGSAQGASRIYFKNGATAIDSWQLIVAQRTSTNYTALDNKVCNKIEFTIATGITVDTYVRPMFTNDGQLPSNYEPYGYKLFIVSGNTTTNVYLGEVQSTRKIKKFVFDGTQSIYNCVATTDSLNYCCVFRFSDIGMTDIKDYEIYMMDIQYPTFLSDRFTQKSGTKNNDYNNIGTGEIGANSLSGLNRYITFCISGLTTAEEYTDWFTNNPTELYYILDTPTTAAVNEPLRKIGNYVDTITNPVSIPTTSGLNTIDVATTLKPSEMSLTYDGYKLCKRQRYDRTEQLFDLTAKDASRGYIAECYLYSDGTIATDKSGYQISEYIPIESKTSYALNYAASLNLPSICFYDSSYNYISGIQYARVIPIIFQTPSNAAYCRFSMERVLERAVMFNKGSTSLSYQPYLDWK